MRVKGPLFLGGLLVALAMTLVARHHAAPPEKPAVARVAGEKAAVARAAAAEKAEAANEADGDHDAIRKASAGFAAAFSKADAHAVASFWTDAGECHDADGDVMRGRAAIEKGFAAFFKENPKARIDVMVHSIRFPAPDVAVEEGCLRLSNPGKEMPCTTLYSVTHVRQGGQWKIAISREWGADEDRLEDLDWLVGTWKATTADHDLALSFQHDAKKPFLLGQFTKKAKGKTIASGTIRVTFDAQHGQLRSWHFDDDGAHGEALWVRDGNRWVLDAVGVDAGGRATAAVNVLARVDNDAFLWRSIDRVAGDQELPDTIPIRLNRVVPGK